MFYNKTSHLKHSKREMSCLEESASILKRIKPKCPNQISTHKILWQKHINSHVGRMCLSVPKQCHSDKSYKNSLPSVIMQWLKMRGRTKTKHFGVAIKGEKYYAPLTGRENVELNLIFKAHLKHGVNVLFNRYLVLHCGPAGFVPHCRLLLPNADRITAQSLPVYL